MKDKKILLLIAVIILVATGIKVIAFPNRSSEEPEKTNEEYMAVLIDNKEDFNYVAETIQQWPVRSCIDLDGGISSDSREITNEIRNNKEFYDHLNNIYKLNEIDYIIVLEDEVKFDFRIYPQNYHCSLACVESAEDDPIYKHKIDEHWVLYMIPNV